MKKERIDILCVQQGLFESRNQAQRAIMAGIVRDEIILISQEQRFQLIQNFLSRAKN